MEKHGIRFNIMSIICAIIALTGLFIIVYAFGDSTETALYRIDSAILRSIQNLLSGSFSDFFFANITVLANAGVFWIVLSAVFAIMPKTRKMSLTMMIAMLLGLLLGNLIIKNVVARMRPYQMDGAIQLIINKPSEFSFPSGHTLCSFGAAISIYLYKKKLGVLMLILASAIALSRMYLYVHFPTDILGGILLGIITANIAYIITEKIYMSKSKALAKSQLKE